MFLWSVQIIIVQDNQSKNDINTTFLAAIYLTVPQRKTNMVCPRVGGGGVLPYMGYIGTCRGIGYGF